MISARQIFLGRGAGTKTPTARDYVQNGLIAMWDGEWNAGPGVHNSAATTWKNLVSDNPQFDLAITVGNVEWGENYMRLVNRAPAAVCQNPMITMNDNESGTVEIVIFTEQINNVDSVLAVGRDFGGNPFGFCQSSTGSAFKYHGDGWDVRNGETVLYQYVGKDEFRNANPRYMNGVDVSSGSSTTDATVSTKYGYGFGTIDVGRFPGFKRIYSCRIYNRSLDAAEIAANYAIDKARFNLP